MFHRRVVGLGEQEREMVAREQIDGLLRRHVQGQAQGGDDVGRPRLGRHRAIAVLGHGDAHRRGDEPGRGRDVDRADAVAPCTHDVDEREGHGGEGARGLTEGARGPGDLVGGLAARVQGGEQGGGLGLGEVPRAERGEDDAGLLAAEPAALDDLAQEAVGVLGVRDGGGWLRGGGGLGRGHRLSPVGVAVVVSPAMSARRIAGPAGVRMDSGWNWRPTAGLRRCRAAMTIPEVAAGPAALAVLLVPASSASTAALVRARHTSSSGRSRAPSEW